jgi:hypothetical protein
LLAFALVGREFNGVAVGEVEGFVDVEDGLDVVIAWGETVERFYGEAESGGVDDGGGVGLPVVDVEAEELGAFGFFFLELEAGFGGIFGGDAEEDVAVERFSIGGRGREREFDAEFGLTEHGRSAEKKNAETEQDLATRSEIQNDPPD